MNQGREKGPFDLRDGLVELLPRLRRFCMALTKGQNDGDDLCQATIERALSRADQFDPGTKLDSWMYKIAQNIFYDGTRRLKIRGTEVEFTDPGLALVGDDGVRIIEGRSDLARARAALYALPDEQRILMALVVLDGKSYREAADMLDIPIGTVMSRIARARRAIDTHLNGVTAND